MSTFCPTAKITRDLHLLEEKGKGVSQEHGATAP